MKSMYGKCVHHHLSFHFHTQVISVTVIGYANLLMDRTRPPCGDLFAQGFSVSSNKPIRQRLPTGGSVGLKQDVWVEMQFEGESLYVIQCSFFFSKAPIFVKVCKWSYSKEEYPAELFQVRLLISVIWQFNSEMRFSRVRVIISVIWQLKLLNACIAMSASPFVCHAEAAGDAVARALWCLNVYGANVARLFDAM